MLVVTRKEGESILIYPNDIPEGMTVAELFSDGPIRVELKKAHNVQCKLGIDAPKELTIIRDE